MSCVFLPRGVLRRDLMLALGAPFAGRAAASTLSRGQGLADPSKTMVPLGDVYVVTKGRDMLGPAANARMKSMMSARNSVELQVKGIMGYVGFQHSVSRHHETGEIVIDRSRPVTPYFTSREEQDAAASREANRRIYCEGLLKKMGCMTRERWLTRILPFALKVETLTVSGMTVLKTFRPAPSMPGLDGEGFDYWIAELNYMHAGQGEAYYKDGKPDNSHDLYPVIIRAGKAVPSVFHPDSKEPMHSAYPGLVKSGWLPEIPDLPDHTKS